MRRRHTLHGFVTSLLVLSLLLVGPGTTPALAQAAQGELQVALDRFDALRAGLDRLEEALPEAHWTQDALAFELAFEEPEAIAAWVHDRIAFEPYVGVLRGQEGTLQSRAGNAWDQSLLLANLLWDAGYIARIARTEIPSDAAAELIAGVRPPEIPAMPASVDLAEYADASGADAAALDAVAREAQALAERRREASAASAARLRERLDAAGVELGGADVVATMTEEARDYAWVEYRLTEDAPWQAAHPAAPEGAAWLAELEPQETFDGEIPAELQHRFRFRAVIERRLGDGLEVEPVTGAWERPVANMGGVALTYSAVPDGFLKADVAREGEAAGFAETTFMVPVFNEALAPDAQYFDLLGNVVPPLAGDHPAAGVFGALGSALGDATSELSGEEDAVALTAHWLEFTFIAPGGEETVHRRMIVDRLGAERRRTGEVSGPLAPMSDEELMRSVRGTHTFMLAPGRYPAAFVNERSIEGLRGLYDYLETLYAATAESPGAEVLPPQEVSDATRALPLLRAFEAFDETLPGAEEALHTYRATPSLAIVSRSWDGREERTDIVHNARRVLALGAGGAPRADAHGALLAGVWESAAEGLLLADPTAGESTLSFFEAVRAEGVPTRVVVPGSVEEVASLDLPSESREAIRRDLERGYTVVAAERMPAEASVAAWWRVDAATGETLGRGGDGRGQDVSEYIVTPLSIDGFLISTVFGGAGFGLCIGAGGSMGCCLADAATGAAIGLGVGIALSFTYVSASMATLVGFGVDMAGFGAGVAGTLGAPVPTWCASADAGEGPSLASDRACPTPLVVRLWHVGPSVASTLRVG